MMQCYMRQHFADRYWLDLYWLHEHPGGHASWREPTMRKFTEESTTYFVKGPVCKWNVQKMRSESSEYVRKTTGFFTNSWGIKIALETLREQLKENDQFNAVEEIAGPIPEIPLEYDQILKGGGRFWDDVNGGDLLKILCWL